MIYCTSKSQYSKGPSRTLFMTFGVSTEGPDMKPQKRNNIKPTDHGTVRILIKLAAILMAGFLLLNANGEDNDRNALTVKSSLDRKDGIVVEHA